MVGVAQLVEPRVVIPVVVGSSPIVHPTFPVGAGPARESTTRHAHIVGARSTRNQVGPLAQLVEQETLNLLVRGSSPRGPTI